MSQGDLYAATCSWLDGAISIDGAGAPVVLVAVTIATMVLWWMLGGTSKAPNTLGKKVHAFSPPSLLLGTNPPEAYVTRTNVQNTHVYT